MFRRTSNAETTRTWSESKNKGKSAGAASREQSSSSYSSRFFLAAVSVFASVAFCELGLRMFWLNPYRQEVPERVLRLRLSHAQMDHIVDRRAIDPERPRVRLRTDHRSYLLPSGRFDKPDATIVFLGGSTTECVAVQEEVRFPARVSYLLEKKGLRVNTLNAARSGNTIHDSINVLLNHVVEDKPDIVILMEATNDIGLLKSARSYRARMGQPESVSHAARFALQQGSSVLYVMGLFRQWVTSSEAVVPDANPSHLEGREKVKLPRDEYTKRVRAFVRLSRSFDIEPVLMTQPLANIRTALTPDWADPRNQEIFNDIVRTVGTEENVLVIDLVHHLIKHVDRWNEHMNIFYDGMHVTDRGSQIYAEYIAERLQAEALPHRLRSRQSTQHLPKEGFSATQERKRF
jgi:lysophospholipase L1-like esterase